MRVPFHYDMLFVVLSHILYILIRCVNALLGALLPADPDAVRGLDQTLISHAGYIILLVLGQSPFSEKRLAPP